MSGPPAPPPPLEPPPRPPSPELEPRPVAPVFTKHLMDLVIDEGAKCYLEAEVSGVPVPKITWFKDGIPVATNTDYITGFQEGVCTLEIEESMKEDSANWSVKASNSAGYSESHSKLTVKEIKPVEKQYPPIFLEKLSSSNPKEGEKLVLSCKIDGNPLPVVSWYKNAVCIDKSKNYTIGGENNECVLRIEKVSLEDSSEYTCKLTNCLGQAVSSSTVSVIPREPVVAPQFDKALTNVEARAGQPVMMECSFIGTPTPSVTWYKDNKSLKHYPDVEVVNIGNKSQLKIIEAYPKSAGTYTCKCQNKAGEAITTSTVTFKAKTPEFSDSETSEECRGQKPAFYVPLSNVEAYEDEDVTLECSIIGQPKPDISWYHDNNLIRNSNQYKIVSENETHRLCITSSKAKQSGTYSIKASNTFGECKSSCMLHVKSSKSVSECQTQTQEEKTLVKKSHSYTHSVVSSEHTKKSILHDVEIKAEEPKFLNPIQGQIIEEGGSLFLEGTFTGKPAPTITWSFNSKVLHDDENVRLSNMKNKSTLRINKVCT